MRSYEAPDCGSDRTIVVDDTNNRMACGNIVVQTPLPAFLGKRERSRTRMDTRMELRSMHSLRLRGDHVTLDFGPTLGPELASHPKIPYDQGPIPIA